MSAYYNDNEPFVCAWMQNLMDAGLITQGVIDNRPIQEVRADEIKDYTRCHFFAGIAGWDYALRLAGWPDSRAVWTGSCPCQPFSVIGKRRAEKDERHLWPEWLRLIGECRPVTIFGEQVGGPSGRLWLAGVRSNLESLGYAFGCASLCAGSVGAPHRRQRLFWVADSDGAGLDRYAGDENDSDESRRIDEDETRSIGARCGSSGLGEWGGLETVQCKDGKERRFESESFPLAHGVPNRVGRIRAYGNAIVPQVAAEFIKAFMEGA